MSAPLAATCCASHSHAPKVCVSGDGSRLLDEYISVSSESPKVTSVSSAPPSRAQLHALTAVPLGMVIGGVKTGKKGRGGRGGAIKSLIYNIQAGRPIPSLTSPLQSITVTSDFNAVAFSTSTTVPVFYSFYVTLSSFANQAQYLAVFDQYRIDEVEVWLESTVTASPTVVSTTLFSAVDLDDANLPAAIADVSGKQGVITGEVTTGRYHRWKPHMAVAAYSGAFTSYANVPAGWIDSASPNVQHFGLKTACSNDGVIRAITLTARIKVSFRGAGI